MEYIIDISSKNTGLDRKTNNKIKLKLKNTVSSIIKSVADDNCKVANYILNKQVVLEVMLVDNKEISRINKKYRNKDKATNVLSFQAMSKEDILIYKSPIIDIGSIIISVPTCQEEAILYNIDFETYITKIFTHGFLHILGYDHLNDKDATEMLNKEQKVITDLGLKTSGLTKNYWN